MVSAQSILATHRALIAPTFTLMRRSTRARLAAAARLAPAGPASTLYQETRRTILRMGSLIMGQEPSSLRGPFLTPIRHPAGAIRRNLGRTGSRRWCSRERLTRSAPRRTRLGPGFRLTGSARSLCAPTASPSARACLRAISQRWRLRALIRATRRQSTITARKHPSKGYSQIILAITAAKAGFTQQMLGCAASIAVRIMLTLGRLARVPTLRKTCAIYTVIRAISTGTRARERPYEVHLFERLLNNRCALPRPRADHFIRTVGTGRVGSRHERARASDSSKSHDTTVYVGKLSQLDSEVSRSPRVACQRESERDSQA